MSETTIRVKWTTHNRLKEIKELYEKEIQNKMGFSANITYDNIILELLKRWDNG
jgi:hypothetical protein